MNQGNKDAGNLIIVSNRGPNDFVWQDDRWVVRFATGGLVSMIGVVRARWPEGGNYLGKFFVPRGQTLSFFLRGG